MHFLRQKSRLNWHIVMLGMAAVLICGCSIVGPRAIRAGRDAYNEAVNQTENRQMMMTIVRNRYGEPTSMLAVSSIAANIRVTTRASIDVGIGPSEDYAGNLVPFSGAIIYEDNPTISYVPVQGEKYVRQIMAPVPLDILVPLARSLGQKQQLLTVLVKNINNLSNPDFVQPATTGPDPRFSRVVELMTDLSKSGRLVWGQRPDNNNQYAIELYNYAPERLKEVRELLALLGLTQIVVDSRPIIIPVYIAVEKPEPTSIAVSTRSLYDLFEILSASIDVPQEHVSSGMARSFSPPGLPGKDIRIYRSDDQPASASAAANYRGLWFYIDDTDQASKLIFLLTRVLWSAAVTAEVTFQGAPVLTIPVTN